MRAIVLLITLILLLARAQIIAQNYRTAPGNTNNAKHANAAKTGLKTK